MKFPLGVYPVETMEPKQGYSVLFEAADGDDESGEWEAWPDRYVYDIVVTADRLPTLCRGLFSLLPTRVYPILDVIGHDAYREIDPYISWDLLGLDHLLDAMARYHDFFYEDGMCGFGAMLDDPFLYVFVDEHKIVTVRTEPEMQARVERILQAFDLEMKDDPAGADAAAHEHRSVLLAPEGNPQLLTGDEVIELLRDEWRLSLNVDPDINVDDDGRDLGVTGWRCVVRVAFHPNESIVYAEVYLYASSLTQAEQTAFEAVADEAEERRAKALAAASGGSSSGTKSEDAAKDPENAGGEGGGEGAEDDDEPMLIIVAADRLEPDEFARALRTGGRSVKVPPPEAARVCRIRWT